MFDFDAAAALPENILFGTSSWNYPGWQNGLKEQGAPSFTVTSSPRM